MEQLNKVILRGYVGNVSTYSGGGRMMSRFSLGTSHAYRASDGSPVIDTQWHTVVCWEGRSVKGLDCLEKGMRVQVEGRLKYNRYTAEDMTEKTVTEIIAAKMEILPDEGGFQYEM